MCVNSSECQAVPQYLFGIVSLLYWWHQPIDPISDRLLRFHSQCFQTSKAAEDFS